MRRWLNIILLVLMPLQFTWVAAAIYCQHESASEVSHFGHHEHPQGDNAHHGLAKKSNGEDKSGKLAVDGDCDFCHFGAKPLFVPGGVPDLAGAQIMPELAEPMFSTRAPDHPDRPNWRIA